jgi:hypothetical protein
MRCSSIAAVLFMIERSSIVAAARIMLPAALRSSASASSLLIAPCSCGVAAADGTTLSGEFVLEHSGGVASNYARLPMAS